MCRTLTIRRPKPWDSNLYHGYLQQHAHPCALQAFARAIPDHVYHWHLVEQIVNVPERLPASAQVTGQARCQTPGAQAAAHVHIEPGSKAGGSQSTHSDVLFLRHMHKEGICAGGTGQVSERGRQLSITAEGAGGTQGPAQVQR